MTGVFVTFIRVGYGGFVNENANGTFLDDLFCLC